MQNKSSGCMVGSPSENQIVKHANSILKLFKISI